MNRTSLAVLGMMAGLVTSASALPLSGSISFNNLAGNILGNVTYTGPDLSSATSITVGVVEVTGTTGDFNCGINPVDCVVVTSLVEFNPNPFAVPPGVYLDFLFVDSVGQVNRYSFSSTGATVVGSVTSDDLTIGMQGQFRDYDAITGGTQSGEALFSLTQAGGPNNDVSFSGTLQTPSSAIPEPGTWALFGTGLIGLAVAGRRKLSKKA
jgi:hypothetical protein